MESLHNLEVTVAAWYKGMPHLPKNGQKWLAENIWWLVLVGVILGALGIFTVLSATLFAGAILVSAGGVVGAALGGIALVWLAFAIGEVVVSALAISPLKSMRKKGWSLLFLVTLINVASLVLAFVFNFNLMGLVWGLLVAAVGAYFLFEIRDDFTSAKAHGNTKDKDKK